MKKVLNLSVYLFLSLILLASCKVEELEKFDAKPDFLGPVAQTSIGFYDLDTIRPIAYTASAGVDLNITYVKEVPLPIPPIGPMNLKKDTIKLSEIVTEIGLREISVKAEFINDFPFTINKGTKIVGRDALSGEELFSINLTTDLEESTKFSQQVVFPKTANITSNMTVGLENFSSPGKSLAVFTNDNTKIKIDITVQSIKISKVSFKPNLDYTKSGKSEFKLDNLDEDLETFDPSSALYVYLSSDIPANLAATLELQDESGKVVYKFFEGNPIQINAAPVDANGETTQKIDNPVIEIKFKEIYEKLKTAKYIVATANIKTGGASTKYVLTEKNSFDMLVTGRIKFDPAKVKR